MVSAENNKANNIVTRVPRKRAKLRETPTRLNKIIIPTWIIMAISMMNWRLFFAINMKLSEPPLGGEQTYYIIIAVFQPCI